MALMEVTVSWGTAEQDPALKEWRIYASTSVDDLGSVVATAEANARTRTFSIEEGEYYFQVVPVSMGGVEGEWARSVARERVFVTGRTQTAPDALSNVAVQQVSPDVGARVAVDPLPPEQEAEKLQIIEGSDPATGKLLAEVPVQRDGPREESAPIPSQLFPLDGSDAAGATRTLQVRAITKGGQGGAATSQAVVMPERATMEGVTVAAVDTSGGGTLTNFPTPDGSLFFTHVGADGFKTTRLPLVNDSATAALLGAINAGARWQLKPTPYPQVVKIESNEVDLGANLVFVLECFDQVQRVTAAGLWTSTPVWALSLHKAAPSLDRDVETDNTLGPAWLTRSISGEGKCRFPIRHARWEYVIGTSATVAHADGDYKPIVPGAWISGRYVRVRLVVRDMLGMHQIKTGNIKVFARVQRVDRRGAGSPEASIVATPGSRYLDTAAQLLYVKGAGQGNTGWVDVRGPAGAKVRTGSSSPEASVTGARGDLYLQDDGSANGLLWVKRTGTGNTGWAVVGQPGLVVSQKSANFNVSNSDNGTLFPCNPAGGAITVGLVGTPTFFGFSFGLFRTSGGPNALTFTPGGAHVVHGAVGLTISDQYTAVWFTYIDTNTWAAVYGRSATGSGPSLASTTEVLTGTDSAKAVTPDALAALWEQGSDEASAATIALGEGGFFHITGTTDISDIDFDDDKAGRAARLRFDDSLTLVHSATLICPEGRDLKVHEDDVVVVVSEGSDVVRVVGYMPAYPELMQVLSGNDTGANNNSVQPWFPTKPSVTLKAGCLYDFEGLLWLSRSAGVNPHTTSCGFGGTATLTSINGAWESKAGDGVGGAIGATLFSAVTHITLKASSSSATEQILFKVRGVVRVNAAGTLIPEFQYSAAPGQAPTVIGNSFFRLKYRGPGTVAEIGPWA